jgi:hypothetical protein
MHCCLDRATLLTVNDAREIQKLQGCTVGPIDQKALNKVVSYTDATLTLPDATRRYQTLPVATRRYQMLTDVTRLLNPTVFRTNLGNSES